MCDKEENFEFYDLSAIVTEEGGSHDLLSQQESGARRGQGQQRSLERDVHAPNFSRQVVGCLQDRCFSS